MDNNGIIKQGEFVIIKRQKYTKLHKFTNLDSTATLGKDQIELRNIVDQKFYTTFKIIPKEGRNKRLSTLEVCNETDVRSSKLRDVLGIKESGVDNRNIKDNGESQALKSEDIDKLRESCTASSQIVEKIVENSKTFNSKTEYSQDKYLKKKEKKYFEFVQIIKPNIRLLSEIYYRQDPDKILGLRIDTLSQIISYSGVNAYGNFLLYESGTNGLVPAAFLNSMGANTEAQLIYMHPGNVPQKQAVLALNMPDEQTDRCISVNLYSVLREFYQGSTTSDLKEIAGDLAGTKRKADEDSDLPAKKMKESLEESQDEDCDLASAILKELSAGSGESNTDNQEESQDGKLDDLNEDDKKPEKATNNQPKWQIENKRACAILKEKLDCLVIVAREHPASIIKALLPFIKPSRPIVIFNLSREILAEMYVELKSSTEVTRLHLTSNWMRFYQILPNRTHPEVSMNCNSGYLLCGYSIR